MFGSGGFGSNTTQSNSGGGFGGGFGQSAQQNNAASTGAGGFGAFNQTSNTNSGFGGASSGFGSATGNFGSANNSTGAAFGGFGSTTSAANNTSATPAFGQGAQTSLFGGSSSTGFGGTSSGVGATGLTASGFGSAQATGTARVAFEPFVERGTAGRRDVYRNICFMDAYKAFSPEELRLEDYQAGRKKPDAAASAAAGFGQSGAGAFGQSSNTGTFGQTPGGSAFGQTSGGFGQPSTTTGFGSTGTSGFGQPSGGGFGLSASKPATGFGSTGAGGNAFSSGSGIGGFGQSGTASGTGGGLFGASTSKPAFGQTTATTPGAFGSSTGATSGGAFGSSTGTSGFGNSSTGTTGFGANNTGFGAQKTGFGATSTGGNAFGQTGSSGFGASTSFGAKPAFGSGTSAFGATSQPAASGTGSTGLFGQSNTNTGGGFGQAGSTGFGNTGATGFGSSINTNTGGGLFGGSSNNPAGNTGGGMFGNNAGATGTGAGGSGGLFANKPTTGFGTTPGTGFGGTSTGSGLFSTSNANTSAGQTSAGGGLFGNTGTNTGGGGLFSSTNNATNTAGATGGGLFGNTSSGTSLFANKPAASTGGGLFGVSAPAPSTAATGTPGGGLFGNTSANTSGGLFGATNTSAAAGGTTGGGLFGNAGATGGTATGFNAGGGLFSNKPATSTGGGLFNTSSGAAGTTGFGFGSAATNTQQQQQQAQPSLSLFGQPSFQQQQQLQPAQPAQPVGLFATQIDKQPYGANSLFDTSKLVNRAAQKVGSSHLTATPLRATVSDHSATDKELEKKKRGLSLNIVSSPLALSATSNRLRSRGFAAPSTAAKKSSIVGIGSSTLRAHRVSSAATGGSASTTVSGTPAGKSRETIALFGRDGFLSPDAQIPHSNVKRLVITRKPSFSNASSPSAAKNTTPRSRTRSAAAASDEAEEGSSPLRERASTFAEILTAQPLTDNPWADTPRAMLSGTRPRSAAKSSTKHGRVPPSQHLYEVYEEEEEEEEPLVDDESDVPTEANEEDYEEQEEGDEYWMRPSLADLRAMSTQQLRAVKNFTVGRTGVGQVSFGKPVDLTTVGSLSAIAGGVVLFDDRVCTVYPDESNKPPRGQGLNVPAIISLHDCWPIDRSTGEAIVHMDDPRVRKHIRRLRKIEETEFIDFVNGTWIFKVEHFSRYGLEDNSEYGADEEDYMDQPETSSNNGQKQQGFGKATTQTHGAQSQMGGSRAVAADQPTSTLGSSDDRSWKRVSFDNELLESMQSEEESDMDANSCTSGLFRTNRNPAVSAPMQRPPRQLLLGGRHAESLRRGPVMRASLFSTKSDNSNNGLASKAVSSAAVGGVAAALGSKRTRGQDGSTGHLGFGRIPSRSPAVPFALPSSHQRQQQQQQPQQRERKSISAISKHKKSVPFRKDFASQATTASRARSIATSVAALDLPPPSKYLRTSETRITRELLSLPQPYAKSLTHGRSGMGADAGLMMARSFRVAFGPQGQLVYLQGALDLSTPSSDESSKGRGTTASIVIDNIARHVHALPGTLGTVANMCAENDEVDDESAAASLDSHRRLHLSMVRAQWSHSRVSPPEASLASSAVFCPSIAFTPDSTTIAAVVNSVLQNADSPACSVVVPEYERKVLEFASLLFDDLQKEANEDDGDLTAEQILRVRCVRRRQGVTKWLMGAVYEAVQRDLLKAGSSKSAAAASIFALLTGHRIEAACLAATSHRDYRLATLVAQCGAGATGGGGNDRQIQALIRAQLERMSASDDYRRVYELLSGNVGCISSVDDSSSDCSIKHVAQDLDWKRAFGLGLWYANSPADSIAGSVIAYQNGFAQPDSMLAPPLPGWLFSAGRQGEVWDRYSLKEFAYAIKQGDDELTVPGVASDLCMRGVWDPIFQLLRVYSDPSQPLESALLSEGFSAARGDVRLPALLAWLLFVVRKARGFEDAQETAATVAGSRGELVSISYDRLLAGWAFQLESLGLWHWACYVLLQLSSQAHKAHAIRSLLERSLQSSLPTTTLGPAVGGELLGSSSSCELDEDARARFDQIEEQVRFVLHELHLPRQWLYEAYATRSRYDQDWLETRVAGQQQRHQLQSQVDNHPVLTASLQRRTASGKCIVPSFFQSTMSRPAPSSSVATQSDICALATLRHVSWLLSAHELTSAHTLVVQRIAPDAILRGEYQLLMRVLSYLDPKNNDCYSSDSLPSSPMIMQQVPAKEWGAGGQVYLSFLTCMEELPAVLRRIAVADESRNPDDTGSVATGEEENMQEIARIYQHMVSLLTALPSLAARFDASHNNKVDSNGVYDGHEAYWFTESESCNLRVKCSVAISDMASVVTGLIQEMESSVPGLVGTFGCTIDSDDNDACFAAVPDVAVNSAALPLAQDMRILRTFQMARSCFDSLVSSEFEV